MGGWQGEMARRAPRRGTGRGLGLLSLSFLMGGLLGTLLAWGLGEAAVQAVAERLQLYGQILDGTPLRPELAGVLWEYLCWPLAALLLGLTAAGRAAIPALLALRGFLLYTAAALLVRAGGAWAALLLLGPSALAGVPALFLLGLPAWRRAGRPGGRTGPRVRMGAGDRRELLMCALCIVVLLMAAILEYSCMPALLRRAAGYMAMISA